MVNPIWKTIFFRFCLYYIYNNISYFSDIWLYLGLKYCLWCLEPVDKNLFSISFAVKTVVFSLLFAGQKWWGLTCTRPVLKSLINRHKKWDGGGGWSNKATQQGDRQKTRSNKCKVNRTKPAEEEYTGCAQMPKEDAGNPSDGGLAEKWHADLHGTSCENLCTLSLRIIGSEQRECVRVCSLACRKFGLRSTRGWGCVENLHIHSRCEVKTEGSPSHLLSQPSVGAPLDPELLSYPGKIAKPPAVQSNYCTAYLRRCYKWNMTRVAPVSAVSNGTSPRLHSLTSHQDTDPFQARRLLLPDSNLRNNDNNNVFKNPTFIKKRRCQKKKDKASANTEWLEGTAESSMSPLFSRREDHHSSV